MAAHSVETDVEAKALVKAATQGRLQVGAQLPTPFLPGTKAVATVGGNGMGKVSLKVCPKATVDVRRDEDAVNQPESPRARVPVPHSEDRQVRAALEARTELMVGAAVKRVAIAAVTKGVDRWPLFPSRDMEEVLVVTDLAPEPVGQCICEAVIQDVARAAAIAMAYITIVDLQNRTADANNPVAR